MKRKSPILKKYKKTHIKTEAVDTGGPEGAGAACAAEVPGPVASRTAILEALISELDVPQARWPEEALKAVIERFGRMPRGGWQFCHSKYCISFTCNTSLDEFKRRANSVITSNSGNKCSRNRPSASRQLTRTSTRKPYMKPRPTKT